MARRGRPSDGKTSRAAWGQALFSAFPAVKSPFFACADTHCGRIAASDTDYPIFLLAFDSGPELSYLVGNRDNHQSLLFEKMGKI
jgi:hypothetical protein